MAVLPDRTDYTTTPNTALCAAYRQIISDRIGGVSDAVRTMQTRETATDARLHALELAQAEEKGMTKSDAKVWGIVIVAISAIVSTVIKLYLEGIIS